jgi:hypothetical protein
MLGGCTGLWRGYVATWRLEHDSLFLVRVQTDACGTDPKDLDIAAEFGSRRVFAAWATDTLVRAGGEMIRYVHMGYGSLYEREIRYVVRRGILLRTTETDFVVREPGRLSPGYRPLHDTLLHRVLSVLRPADRRRLPDPSIISLTVRFDREGALEEVQLESAYRVDRSIAEFILQKARASLAGLPLVMVVNHRLFDRAEIGLDLHGHCLRHPGDRVYGCDSE